MSSRFEYKLLRAILLFLVFFDLLIAILALFFPHFVIATWHFDDPHVPGAPYRQGVPIEPIWMRGVGILWVLAAYVQYVAWRAPVARLTAVHLAIAFRFVGGSFELVELLFLLPAVGFDHWLLLWTFPVFVVGDYALVATMIWCMNRLGLPWRNLPLETA
jgi:hypothetical protein